MAKKIKILSSTAGYNLAAQDYDKKEKYLDSFEKGLLLPLLGDLRGKKVLDIGAGTGRLSLRLAEKGAKVTALDLSQKMLEKLKQKNRKIRAIIADAEKLPFPDNSFDFVIAAFFIVHLKDPAIFFDEAYRVLKGGGRLIATNVNQKEPPEINSKDLVFKIESYYHRPEKIVEMLKDLAFNIVREEIIKENNIWVNQIIVAEK